MSWQVIQGDCIEAMAQLSEKSIDLVLTDPPHGTTACKWDTVIPFAPMWEHLRRITKRSAAMILTGTQPFSSALVMSNPREFRYDWIWEKTHPTGHLNANKAPLKAHESLLVFYRAQPIYNPQKTNGHVRKSAVKRADYSPVYGTQKFDALPYDSTERFPRSIITFASDKQLSTLHPTQKPIDLLRYLIRTYSNEGDTVLDFTCGSGSTGVACLLENRQFTGIEKDTGYAEIARQRMRDTTTSEQYSPPSG